MKSLRTLLVTLLSVVLLPSCIIYTKHTQTADQKKTATTMIGGKLYTAAWIQHAAEYKALCQQAYNIATERVLHATEKPLPPDHKPWAIVTDIDETFLDNSPNAVHQALAGKDFEGTSWDQWCDLAEADTLMGAVDFFRLADSKGITIFYVSNRSEANRAGTLKNLRHYGFPQAEDAHLLLRSNSSDKTSRREQIMKQYNILLFLGDNLGDFDHLFDSHDAAVRHNALIKYRQKFGKRFIMLPNPNYGTWERALIGKSTTLEDKSKAIERQLRSHR